MDSRLPKWEMVRVRETTKWRYYIVVALVVAFSVLAPVSLLQAQGAATTAGGPNLIPNPSFDANAGEWWSEGTIRRDTNVARGSGGASLAINSGDNGRTGWHTPIRVTPGAYYTLRAYGMSDSAPVDLRLRIWTYDSSGAAINWQEEWLSISESSQWQEQVAEYVAPARASNVIIELANGQDAGPHNLWMDDIYFGEGKVSFEQPSGPRESFAGQRVRIDGNGNFEVNRGGSWEPYFPFGIIPTSWMSSEQAQRLSNQGFNMTFASSPEVLKNVKNATSSFNKNGMMAMVPAVFSSGFRNTGDAQALARSVDELVGSSAASAIFAWWEEPTDGARELKAYPRSLQAHQIIRDHDKVNGAAGSPNFINVSEVGYARSFSDAGDFTGTFRYPLQAGIANRPLGAAGSGFKIAAKLQGSKKPHLMMQVQVTDDRGNIRPTSAQLRALVYHHITVGGKGIVFWWDTQAGGGALKDTDLWPQFPILRREIDTLLPIIRQGDPTWSVDMGPQPALASVDVMAKEYNGESYVVMVNTGDSPKTGTATLSRFSKSPIKGEEVFGKGDVTFEGNSFPVELEPYGTRVYRITTEPAQPPVTNIQPVVTLTVQKASSAFGAPAKLMGDVVTSPDDMGGAEVSVWKKTGSESEWAADGEAVWNPETADYEATRTVSAKTQYQLRVPAPTQDRYIASNIVTVNSRVQMSRPRVSRGIVRRGDRIRARGAYRPGSGGTTKLYFYRLKAGRWALSRVIKVRANRRDGSAGYATRYRPARRGKWFVVAYHEDRSHLPSWSSRTYFKVG